MNINETKNEKLVKWRDLEPGATYQSLVKPENFYVKVIHWESIWPAKFSKNGNTVASFCLTDNHLYYNSEPEKLVRLVDTEVVVNA